MFSGITQGCFAVVTVQQQPDHTQYQISVPTALTTGLTLGASIAVDGVCQTLIQQQPSSVDDAHQLLTFQAITETLNNTTLNELHVDRLISIERSLRFGDEIGGHLLSGHVHGVGTVHNIINTPTQYDLHIHVPQAWLPYIVAKGFIGLNGSSLTVVDVDHSQSTFSVSLIPETLKRTRFADRQVGDRLNVELDQQTRTIVDTVTRILKINLVPLIDTTIH